jgi:hypothetical protein
MDDGGVQWWQTQGQEQEMLDNKALQEDNDDSSQGDVNERT